ncbi:hypothetical protein niasHT_001164 [Heterodera trifolii]|uniref:Lariat debranching enzyme C-terminal domain-containing protein n=1 Tax=Heterodera trifolii TaxID=157864 RepID=A0ABD2LYN3_9BILA
MDEKGSVGPSKIAVKCAIFVPVWFGFVRVEVDGESVQIEDNLSLKTTQFKLPTNGDDKRVVVAANECFVFFLVGSYALYAFELRTEMSFLGSADGPPPFGREWLPVEVQLVHSEFPPPSADCSSVALSHQFDHWDALRGRKGIDKFEHFSAASSSKSNRFLVCTAFSAFLATNFENCAVLERICDSRLEKNSKEVKRFELPFRIGKISAGRDHLIILDSLNGEIWSLGTGTRGELGTGRVEADNWAEGPRRISSFSEADIRCVDIESGAWHSLALTAEGDVYGWGWNGHGQIRHPSTGFSIQPTPFPFDLDDGRATMIRCAGNNSFLLLSDGSELEFGEICTEKPIDKQMAEKMPENGAKNGTEKDEKEGQSQEKDGKEKRQSPSAKRQRHQRTLKVAVVGCSHGQLETIYERMAQMESQQNAKFDLLICCGDFQSIRNHGDLHHFHAPFHHRKLGTFYKYYSGEKVAPLLTLFVGGNHESSGFMAELPNGGWVAPNIFYMGYASVGRDIPSDNDLAISTEVSNSRCLSGLALTPPFPFGHFERPPFRERGSVVSAYHVRSVDIFRLRHLKDGPPLDIFFSHDWPAGITDFGDWETLLRIKPHFTEDVRNNRLGNPATMDLLHQLKPAHWFAAHLHVHFTAVVPHSSASPTASVTRFLALDKPNENPRRRFIQFLHIPIAEDAPLDLCYDPQWLAILRATDQLTEFTDKSVFMPSAVSPPTTADIDSLLHSFGADLRIPSNFQHTAPPEREPWNCKGRPPSLYYRNPQTQQFCERLGIRDLNLMFAQASADCLGIPHFLCVTQPLESVQNPTETTKVVPNPDEIDLGVDEFDGEDFMVDIPSKEEAK